ncbi:predicted protein [Nematostella vectensis]|uniref:Uncharacterized protein n=1 Tax=Nematostella vectensis TaxID=45351 RepID=A7SDL0_NEMVE|nr:predicted protein [Nematostella vectensis]|eukprot:XP_001630243.1 predicted protein [Nematostella vectensis]
MDLRKSLRVVEKKDEQLDASRRILQDQERELQDYRKELKNSVKENEALRHSLTKTKEDVNISRTELDMVEDERERLIKKLVEMEMDGKAASEQFLKLRDVVRRLKEDKRMSAADTAMLTRQREILLQKLEEFERTNKALRRMLRETQQSEEEHQHLRQQQDVLLRKLTEAETSNEDDGQTPMHIAAYEGDDLMVRTLHGMRARADLKDIEDRTPLLLAAMRGHTTVVDYLLDKARADINARSKEEHQHLRQQQDVLLRKLTEAETSNEEKYQL